LSHRNSDLTIWPESSTAFKVTAKAFHVWILVLIASVFVLSFIGEALGKWRAKKRRRAESLAEKESRLEQERVQFEKLKEESLLAVKQMAQEK
jgi:hypothetical protein